MLSIRGQQLLYWSELRVSGVLENSTSSIQLVRVRGQFKENTIVTKLLSSGNPNSWPSWNCLIGRSNRYCRWVNTISILTFFNDNLAVLGGSIYKVFIHLGHFLSSDQPLPTCILWHLKVLLKRIVPLSTKLCNCHEYSCHHTFWLLGRSSWFSGGVGRKEGHYDCVIRQRVCKCYAWSGPLWNWNTFRGLILVSTRGSPTKRLDDCVVRKWDRSQACGINNKSLVIYPLVLLSSHCEEVEMTPFACSTSLRKKNRRTLGSIPLQIVE